MKKPPAVRLLAATKRAQLPTIIVGSTAGALDLLTLQAVEPASARERVRLLDGQSAGTWAGTWSAKLRREGEALVVMLSRKAGKLTLTLTGTAPALTGPWAWSWRTERRAEPSVNLPAASEEGRGVSLTRAAVSAVSAAAEIEGRTCALRPLVKGTKRAPGDYAATAGDFARSRAGTPPQTRRMAQQDERERAQERAEREALRAKGRKSPKEGQQAQLF